MKGAQTGQRQVPTLLVTSAGAQALREIRSSSGKAQVHSSYRGALNMVFDSGIVCAVPESVGRGPLYLTIAGDSNLLEGVPSGAEVTVGRDLLSLRSVEFDFTRAEVYAPSMAFSRSLRLPAGITSNLRWARDALLTGGRTQGAGWVLRPRVGNMNLFTAPLARGVISLTNALAQSDSESAARAAEETLGLGGGLTPSGDDFACGIMLAAVLGAHNGLGDLSPLLKCTHAISLAAERMTGTLSHAFVKEAAHGRAIEKATRSAEALFTGGKHEVVESFQNLIGVGHTSGTDMGTGIVLGAEVALRRSGVELADA